MKTLAAMELDRGVIFLYEGVAMLVVDITETIENADSYTAMRIRRLIDGLETSMWLKPTTKVKVLGYVAFITRQGHLLTYIGPK